MLCLMPHKQAGGRCASETCIWAYLSGVVGRATKQNASDTWTAAYMHQSQAGAIDAYRCVPAGGAHLASAPISVACPPEMSAWVSSATDVVLTGLRPGSVISTISLSAQLCSWKTVPLPSVAISRGFSRLTVALGESSQGTWVV